MKAVQNSSDGYQPRSCVGQLLELLLGFYAARCYRPGLKPFQADIFAGYLAITLLTSLYSIQGKVNFLQQPSLSLSRTEIGKNFRLLGTLVKDIGCPCRIFLEIFKGNRKRLISVLLDWTVQSSRTIQIIFFNSFSS
jgi:hypothetical protein